MATPDPQHDDDTGTQPTSAQPTTMDDSDKIRSHQYAEVSIPHTSDKSPADMTGYSSIDDVWAELPQPVKSEFSRRRMSLGPQHYRSIMTGATHDDSSARDTGPNVQRSRRMSVGMQYYHKLETSCSPVVLSGYNRSATNNDYERLLQLRGSYYEPKPAPCKSSRREAADTAILLATLRVCGVSFLTGNTSNSTE